MKTSKQDNQPAVGGGGAPCGLDTLPYELKLAIAETLPTESLRTLAQCSKFYLDLAFAAHPTSSNIILNANTVQLFQDGGVFETYCRDVRSICIKPPGRPSSLIGWMKAHRDNRSRFYRRHPVNHVETPEITILHLRTAIKSLPLFPNLRSLRIYYELSACALENNLYLAIIKSIPPICYQILEQLDFQIVIVALFGLPTRVSPPYEEILSKLPLLDQEFLGPEISYHRIEELVMENLPKMPNLGTFKISSTDFVLPLMDSRADFYRGCEFYYFSMNPATSPLLTALHIETTDNTIPDVNPGPLDPEYDGNPEDFKWLDILRPLGGFQSITSLTLRIRNNTEAEIFERLAARFPNLTHFSINLFTNDLLRADWQTTHVIRVGYSYINGWKHLKTLELPWSREDDDGSAAPNSMGDMCVEWRRNGLNSLDKVVFTGIRIGYFGWEDIEIVVRLREEMNGGIDMEISGDVEDWQDLSDVLPSYDSDSDNDI
ncbi:hypothetical protein TWF506_010679 [Arthrobotrys conoides]|uniref:Uncharacterized protein n=1 Tax=Arthrobotrys conoides TaxID=74498 RepID=A0AAN8NE99_9PEZI